MVLVDFVFVIELIGVKVPQLKVKLIELCRNLTENTDKRTVFSINGN